MLKVGLTGGIATGKSFVLEVFKNLGCEVIDADAVAHEVIEPGKPAFQDIVNHFGADVIGEDGKIDRAKLGAIVFADANQREKLNSIVHPRVFESQAVWFESVDSRNPDAIAVVDAALMIETGSYRRFDKIVVAYCDPGLQIERLMARNNLTREQAIARISAQMPSAEKMKYADFTIDTTRGFDETRQQVEALYLNLKEIQIKESLKDLEINEKPKT